MNDNDKNDEAKNGDGPDDPLLPLADKIAEGSAIDSGAEQRAAAAGASQSTLQSLLELAAISAAHKAAELTFEALDGDDAAVPQHWAHLLVKEHIGGGASAEVYRAYDGRLQTYVALKLSSAPAHSRDASRLLDEARLLVKVRHENVVRVHGADLKRGKIGMWMDLVQGQTLEALTKSQGFSEGEAINVGIELCRALAAVHKVGVLHGDIKAHNVIRQDGNGRYVLVDFGAGRPLNVTPDAGRDVIGTPVYLAPEVLDDQPRSTASDIYSLGVLLFHLVTNDYPVYATSHAALVEAHRTGARKRLRDLRADLSGAFVSLVERATANDPHKRFASAGALQDALVDVISPASNPDPEPKPDPWFRRNGLRVWAVTAAATIVLLAGVAMWRPPVVGPGPDSGGSQPNGAAPPTPSAQSFEIEAAFYRVVRGAEERLTSASRVRVKDKLRMSVETTRPAYVYVVNEDEKDHAYLLYPLPGDDGRPLASNRSTRLPAEDNWFVNSKGGKEHLLVFASIAPLTLLDEAFKKLAAPRREAQLLPPGTVEAFGEQFRSIGGLTPIPPTRQAFVTRLREMFMIPLEGRETVKDGMWARQLTIASE